MFDKLFRRSGFTSDDDFMNLVAQSTEALLWANRNHKTRKDTLSLHAGTIELPEDLMKEIDLKYGRCCRHRRHRCRYHRPLPFTITTTVVSAAAAVIKVVVIVGFRVVVVTVLVALLLHHHQHHRR